MQRNDSLADGAGELLLGGLREPADNEIEPPPTHSFPVPAARRSSARRKLDGAPPPYLQVAAYSCNPYGESLLQL